MIKTLQKVSIEGTYFNIIKDICNKSTARIILSCENLKSYPLRSRISTVANFIQHSFGSPSYSN